MIDLRQIDAKTTLAGNNVFKFIGEQVFSGHAGERRFVTGGGYTYLNGDTDGNGKADISIKFLSELKFTADDSAALTAKRRSQALTSCFTSASIMRGRS